MHNTRYKDLTDLEVNELYRTQTWINLSLVERVDALQELANRSANSCGNNPCKVELKEMDDSRFGNIDKNKIYINELLVTKGETLSSPNDDGERYVYKYHNANLQLMDTIHHENYHAYQVEVVMGKLKHDDLKEGELWKANANIDRYVVPENDADLYRIQSIERTAYDYAEYKTKTAFEEIEKNYSKDSQYESYLKHIEKNSYGSALEIAKTFYKDNNIQETFDNNMLEDYHKSQTTQVNIQPQTMKMPLTSNMLDERFKLKANKLFDEILVNQQSMYQFVSSLKNKDLNFADSVRLSVESDKSAPDNNLSIKKVSKKDIYDHVNIIEKDNKFKDLITMLVMIKQGHDIKYNEEKLKQIQTELSDLNRIEQKKAFVSLFDAANKISKDLNTQELPKVNIEKNQDNNKIKDYLKAINSDELYKPEYTKLMNVVRVEDNKPLLLFFAKNEVTIVNDKKQSYTAPLSNGIDNYIDKINETMHIRDTVDKNDFDNIKNLETKQDPIQLKIDLNTNQLKDEKNPDNIQLNRDIEVKTEVNQKKTEEESKKSVDQIKEYLKSIDAEELYKDDYLTSWSFYRNTNNSALHFFFSRDAVDIFNEKKAHVTTYPINTDKAEEYLVKGIELMNQLYDKFKLGENYEKNVLKDNQIAFKRMYELEQKVKPEIKIEPTSNIKEYLKSIDAEELYKDDYLMMKNYENGTNSAQFFYSRDIVDIFKNNNEHVATYNIGTNSLDDYEINADKFFNDFCQKTEFDKSHHETEVIYDKNVFDKCSRVEAVFNEMIKSEGKHESIQLNADKEVKTELNQVEIKAEENPEPTQLDADKEVKTELNQVELKSEEKPEPTQLDANKEVKTELNSNNYKLHDIEDTRNNKEKFNDNVEAIRVLKEIGDREATEEEKQILSKYSGFGGLSMQFSVNADGRQKLQELITKEELDEMKRSSLTAFYTKPEVVDKVYEALNHLGVKENTKILEPCCGTGNFIGRNNINNAQFTGIELDQISGQIAKKLYPDADIKIQPFQELKADNEYDIVIGNVPFGDFSPFDKDFNKKNLLIHDYFISKSLDLTRENGIVAIVTSKGTMDKQDLKARMEIENKANLLGAVRLPVEAFKESGTQVVTDVLFFQKKNNNQVVQGWTQTNNFENEKSRRADLPQKDLYKINQYYIDKPNMILGNTECYNNISRYGKYDLSVKLGEDQNLKELFSNAIKNLPSNIYQEREVHEQKPDKIDIEIEALNFAARDNKIYFNNGENIEDVTPSKKADLNKMIDFINIKDLYNKVVDSQLNNESNGELNEKQTQLKNALYKFVDDKNGYLNEPKNKKVLNQDIYYPSVSGLLLKDNGTVKESPILNERTINNKMSRADINTVDDALVASMDRYNKINMDFVADTLKTDKPELLNELLNDKKLFLNPKFYLQEEDREHLLPFQYLGGNIQEKIDDVNKVKHLDMHFDINLNSLNEIKPERVSFDEIKVNLGSNLIQPSDVRDFIKDSFNINKDVSNIVYENHSASWHIEAKKAYSYENASTFGTNRFTGLEIMEKVLNGSSLQVMTPGTKDTPSRVDEKATILVNSKALAIEDEFNKFLSKRSDIKNRIEEDFNQRFNNYVNVDYSGSKLNLSGLNKNIELRKHQIEAISQTLYNGNTLLAHPVGAGKTMEMIVSAMKKKELGISDKPCFVLPKSVIGQFAAEFKKCYPTANLLVANEKNLNNSTRQEFLANARNGNYDAVLMSQEQFTKIPLSKKTISNHLQEEYNSIVDSLEMMGDLGSNDFTVKKLEGMKLKIQEKIKENALKPDRDVGITFEKTGIDALYIDEAHDYKNCAKRCNTTCA